MHLLLNHEYQTFFVPSTRQFYPIFYKYIYDIERKRREEDMKKIMSLIEHNNRENQDEINQDYLQELNLNLHIVSQRFFLRLSELRCQRHIFQRDL